MLRAISMALALAAVAASIEGHRALAHYYHTNTLKSMHIDLWTAVLTTVAAGAIALAGFNYTRKKHRPLHHIKSPSKAPVVSAEVVTTV